MLARVDSTELQPLLKRRRLQSDDGHNSASPPLTKRRQQQPPTTPTPKPSLERAPPSSRPPAAPLTPPDSSKLATKRKSEDNNSVPNLPNKRRIEEWLYTTRSRRKSWSLGGEPEETGIGKEKGQYGSAGRRSCPPQLQFEDPDPNNRQRPLLEVLQEMSQSRKQSFGAASVASGRSSRPPPTSHADYRKVLRNNGVLIDHKGEKIPQELRDFLGSHILKERSSKLSGEAIAEVVEVAVKLADSPEGNVYNLADTAMLPIKRLDGRGGNTPWYSDGLPRNPIYPIPIAAPKPDIHLGYSTDHTSNWQIEENAVIDHPAARRLTQPAKGNCFPFFNFELKSEAMGGNLWQAENQAAGSGSSCVNTMRWLYGEANPGKIQSTVDSIAFTACFTHRLVNFYVHFYMPDKDQHYMARLASCDPLCKLQIQKSNHLVENILEHCLGDRQKKTREALALLYPFPEHWKSSRPASVMESQNSAAGDDDIAGDHVSNKSRRTE